MDGLTGTIVHYKVSLIVFPDTKTMLFDVIVRYLIYMNVTQ
jgi:hypothetical protein